ncbi:hypothetical protein [Spiroplasma ixodetis]|uniref:hypothetical protein n=1 Tax=Spiroplasma ixodetis TaxID=2141 RepID=UPI0025764914|nr:hypothetical protein [Spiroplasma ixodetis]WJG71072.1 hypothetical protein SIXOD_v1c24000 [Spiroplasma ixodetis Y32]
MEILIEESKVGTLKLSSLVIKKFIYMLLINDNYQLTLEDVEVLMLETKDITAINNNIVVRIKLIVNPNEDLVNLKNKINNLILRRTESALNLFLLNIHIIFIAQTKEVEINNARTKEDNPAL